jgi:hypothetical protein
MSKRITEQDLFHVPSEYDRTVILFWIGDMEATITWMEQEGRLGVFIKYFDGHQVQQRLLRFFVGGGKTHCSIDWDSTQNTIADLAFLNFFK